jgi:hypothetical protein
LGISLNKFNKKIRLNDLKPICMKNEEIRYWNAVYQAFSNDRLQKGAGSSPP